MNDLIYLKFKIMNVCRRDMGNYGELFMDYNHLIPEVIEELLKNKKFHFIMWK